MRVCRSDFMIMDKNNKSYQCIFCGAELRWDNCQNAADIPDEYSDDDTATIWYFTCPNCGCDYKIIEPCMEMRETEYKSYWQ